MFRTELMQKVRVLALEMDKKSLISALHKIGIIDLRKPKLEISDDKPMPYSNELSDSLIRVSGAIQLLEPMEISKGSHMDPEKALKEAKSLSVINRIYELSSKKKQIEEDQNLLNYALYVANAFSDIEIDFSKIRSEHLGYKAFEAEKKGVKLFKKRVGELKGHYEEHIKKINKKKFLIFIVYEKKGDIEEKVKELGLNELDLTARYLDSIPLHVIKNARKKRSENQKVLDNIEMQMYELSRRNYSKLSNIREILQIELERADVSSNFKRTEKTFVVEGWIKKERVEELREVVAKATKNRSYVEEIEADELAPTSVKRPKFLRPFDYLMDFYSTQRSDEVDPAWIFIISFPIFYGLMVSDVGYGIVSFFFSTWITRRTDPEGLMCNAAKIWQLNAMSAIIFGIITNQYFGFQLNSYFLPFNGIDWLKNATSIIAITILFGIVQVTIGLFFGFINNIRRGHRKIAFSKITSIITILAGTIAVSGALFSLVSPQITNIATYIAVGSLLLTAILSGHEATELTNLITHPLSYARIMGFGLASVIIALLIDQYFTPHLSSGILIFIIYSVIFILLHFLNMIVGIFEGIVQGVRLNFVEFFSKFYIGNGIKFRPFSYKRVYTKE